MLDWLQANKEWFLSGLGIAVASGIAAAVRHFFFKKTPPTAHIIVRVESGNSDAVSDSQLSASAVPLERVARLTPAEIQAVVDGAPLLQRDTIGKHYEGIRVEWETELVGATQQGDLVRLHLKSKGDRSMSSPSIWCKVKLADYRELAILQRGARIRVSGMIENVDRMGIDIGDARLSFFDA